MASRVTGQILEAEEIRRFYPSKGKWGSDRDSPIRAVDGISFEVREHETLGLVGESGCGKTTTAKMVLRLEPPSAGRIRFRGRDTRRLKRADLAEFRQSVQAVFQDPWSSLNPRMRVGDIVREPLDVLGRTSRNERNERVSEAFVSVGLDPSLAQNYPHEFSGGMRQRVAVARALVTSPGLIVLDEPVSALDVSIRAQIMNLLKELQERLGIAYLLIAHDLATVRQLSHTVAAMYLGQFVELGQSEDVLGRPLHPYTVALISASLSQRPGEKLDRLVLEGEVPSPVSPPSGCRFHTRCWLYNELGKPEDCTTNIPPLRSVEGRQLVACHFAEQVVGHESVPVSIARRGEISKESEDAD